MVQLPNCLGFLCSDMTKTEILLLRIKASTGFYDNICPFTFLAYFLKISVFCSLFGYCLFVCLFVCLDPSIVNVSGKSPCSSIAVSSEELGECVFQRDHRKVSKRFPKMFLLVTKGHMGARSSPLAFIPPHTSFYY